DTKVRLKYIDHNTGKKNAIVVLSFEYFKQTVFMVPVDIPGVFCLQIKSFNRKTSEDMFRFLSLIEKQGKSGLIIDLRSNPGGPPLAAQEISSFFLPGGQEFAFFQKKGQDKALMKVPDIGEKYHYKGPIAILVNKESGSASELFSGILQKRKRAILVGTNTAGRVMLKSMFDYDDGSMLLLVTARGHFWDGSVFDFGGLIPDVAIEDKDSKVDLVHFAANYLK